MVMTASACPRASLRLKMEPSAGPLILIFLSDKSLLSLSRLNLSLYPHFQLPSLPQTLTRSFQMVSSLRFEAPFHKRSLLSSLPHTVCFRHTWPSNFLLRFKKILVDGIDFVLALILCSGESVTALFLHSKNLCYLLSGNLFQGVNRGWHVPSVKARSPQEIMISVC